MSRQGHPEERHDPEQAESAEEPEAGRADDGPSSSESPAAGVLDPDLESPPEPNEPA
jgi:hypothetical protein